MSNFPQLQHYLLVENVPDLHETEFASKQRKDYAGVDGSLTNLSLVDEVIMDTVSGALLTDRYPKDIFLRESSWLARTMPGGAGATLC